MSEVPQGLESALGAAFGGEAPEAPKAPAAKAAPTAEPTEVEVSLEIPGEDPAELLLPTEEPETQEAAPEAEPEFEIEIEPGKPEVLPLAKLKELAARGAKAGRAFEENARVREALQAHVVQQQMHNGFQQAVAGDIAQIRALESQLAPFERADWQRLYDEDPFQAMKLKEQRDQLREHRAAAINQLSAKQQQFHAQFQENTQRLAAAESEALLAKVPTWRNAEKAQQEKGEIAQALTSYGFAPNEIGQLMDHRMVLVARDAAAYRKLLADKDARVKQARQAPATAKPGAAATPNGRANADKAIGLVKAHGAKGNHKAQEQLMTRLLGAAFK